LGDNSAKRRQLFEKDPHCHWCGRETILGLNHKGQPWPYSATVDHVKSRMHPEGRGPDVVLACYACNMLRNKRDHKARVGKPVPPMPGERIAAEPKG
jgi:hypothetical protein